MDYRPMQAILQKTRDEYRNAENSARLAHSFGKFNTTGWGEFLPEDKVDFAGLYLERPAVSYGASFADDDEVEKLVTTRYPRCGGVVVRWDKTEKGLYKGAWVAIWVEDRSPFAELTTPDTDMTYEIVHDFTFLGVATKPIPAALKGDDDGKV